MPRTRVISATQALFASTNATGSQSGNINQLHRIQSANYSAAINRTNVEQWGELAPIDQIIVEAMTVNLDFSYLSTNVLNEANLGFVVDGSTQSFSGFLNHATDERNFYILTVPQGQDAVGGDNVSANNEVMGISNGFVNKYSFDARVGGIPSVSVGIEALNMVGYLGSTGQNTPAINPSGLRITGYTFNLPATTSGVAGQVSALRQGDVVFGLSNLQFGVDASDLKIQDVKIDLELAREPQQKLGTYFPFTREVRYPVTVNVSVNANIGDLTTGSLSDLLCTDNLYNLVVSLKKPDCARAGAVAVQYTINGAKLDNQSFADALNSNETVSLQFKALVGGPQDLIHQFLISGVLV